jgi:hypothetical protein
MDPFEQYESSNNQDQQDPAAEFLAREQAELDRIEGGVDSLGLDNDNETQNLSAEENIPSQDTYSAISSVDKHFKEPEKITRWREEQRVRITTKDAEEEKKKAEWKEQAKRELEEWYKNRQEQLVKTIANNK